ncbi:MAG: cell surface protein [Alistipes sp.]|nr:cell surface protein [Alistipes sp.]
MKRILDFLFLCVIVVVSSSCNIDEEITTSLPPKIILDSETGVYTVKQGRKIVIAPSYESAEGATYSWIMDGRLLGTSASLSFEREIVGEYYITLTVTTDTGSDSEEIRIDVVELEIPTISIAGSKHQTVALGTTVKLNASLRDTSLETNIRWTLDGEPMATDHRLECSFQTFAEGSFRISVTATNEDGEHSDSVVIEVLKPENMPFVWEFEREAYHTVVGRKLLIEPKSSGYEDDEVRYSWQVDNGAKIEGGASYIFKADAAGNYHISAVATTMRGENEISIAHEFSVTVYDEGVYYRARGTASSDTWSKVFDYTPAPGQFINELKTGGFDGTQTTMEAAIAYAEERLRDENWVSLGGFGGYIVVGFDHSIDNTGNYDLGILGNSFSGSSEPGIVWVMQDENGNGLPDDTWYELAGSETGKATTIQNYTVTYYRPAGAMMPVQWEDNLGNRGEIDYLKQFHRQDYYYPLWIEEDSYTLRGTCLEPRNYDASGNGSYWVNEKYDWGYADNFSPVDRLTDEDNAEGEVNANHFKISNAVDFECEPVELDYIDFVKVQVGVNAKSGWLGELSTEVCGFFDYAMHRE